MQIWFGSAVNVDQLKQMEKSHRELAERLSTTLESIADPFVTFDANWRITYPIFNTTKPVWVGF